MAFKSLKRQGGVALIMAVVSVAIIAIIAVAMSSEQNLLVRRIQNTIFVDTAWQYALGGEQFAAVQLLTDFEAAQNGGTQSDYPYDRASPLTEDKGLYSVRYDEGLGATIHLPLLDVNGGIEGRIWDLQGLFNLKNIEGQAAQQGQQAPVLDGIGRDAFNSLLVNASVPQSMINGLLNSFEDWVDPDQQVSGSDGAEDSYYQTLDTPYLAANQFLSSVDELKLVKGFSEEVPKPSGDGTTTPFELIEEHLILLPERTDLNVNTASAAVLQAYYPHITAANADTLQAYGDDAASPAAFTDASAFQGDAAAQPQGGAAAPDWGELIPVSVSTDYIAVDLIVSLGGIETPLYSVLKRDSTNGISHVVRRQRGK